MFHHNCIASYPDLACQICLETRKQTETSEELLELPESLVKDQPG